MPLSCRHAGGSDVISIGWGTIAIFFVVLAFFYLLAALGVILPLVAVGLWRMGQRPWAALLGLAGLLALGISAGPYLWDRMVYSRTVDALRKAEVSRTVPDLTGKVVAYVSDREHDDVLLECEAILRHSGAAQVYMIEPFDQDRSYGPPPDLSASLDLEALVSGQAALADIPPGFDRWPDRNADERPFCAPKPVVPPLARIDYFVMQGGYYDATAPFRDRLAGIDGDGIHLSLDWYFGPVANPRSFLISAESADLVRFGLDADGAVYPWLPGITDSRVWPDISARFAEIRAILCRNAAKDCPVY